MEGEEETMLTFSIHRVKKVVIGKLEGVNRSAYREIRITSEGDRTTDTVTTEIALFAGNAKELEFVEEEEEDL